MFFQNLRQKILGWCLDERTITIQELHQSFQTTPVDIPDDTGKTKFLETSSVNNHLLVKTPKGFSPIKQSLKTIAYDRFILQLEDGKFLECADNHIVITADGSENFVKDLKQGDEIITDDGLSKVTSVVKTDISEQMFDLELDDDDHVFYTNGILSHNTTVVSMYLLWYVLFHEDKLAVIASKNLKHATEIMSRIKYAFEQLPKWLVPAVDFYNRTTLEFRFEFSDGRVGKSKIQTEATSENTGRGGSPSIVFLDEVAFVPKNIQESLWASLAPSLSTGGKLLLTSTPNGDDDLFAELWRGAEAGTNPFNPIRVFWDEHPERGPEYLEEMTQKLGPLKTRQEVLCEFLTSDSMLLDPIKLSKIVPKPIAFSMNEFDFFVPKEEFVNCPAYIVGVDPATGGDGDFSVIQIFSFPAFKQVGQYRSNRLIIPLLYQKIKWILQNICGLSANNGRKLPPPDVYWSFERNAIGEAISALLYNDETPVEEAFLVNDAPGKMGMYTTGAKKIQSCLKLKNFVEDTKKKQIEICSSVLLSEMKNFAAKGKSYEAKPGSTDDAISATLICIRILEYVAKFDDSARDKIFDYDVDPYSTGEEIPQEEDFMPFLML